MPFPYDTQNPTARAALIASLIAAGFSGERQPYEWSSGGGMMHVAVNLDATGDKMIATGDANGPQEVFIFGYDDSRGGTQIESSAIAGGSVEVATVEDAVQAFQTFWRSRERWLARISAGELDV